MEYAKLNTKILKLLKPVKHRAQLAAAIMLLKQSENKAVEAESVRTDKVVEERTSLLHLWMGPYFALNTAGSLKVNLINKQAGTKRMEPEDMAPGTVYLGEAILVMSHGADEDYNLYLSVGSQEVQISIAGTSTGMSDQYHLSFQIHFSHGEDGTRKFYFSGYFEDKDSAGHITQIPISAVMQTIDASTFKNFDLKYQGASLTTSCQIRSLTLFRYAAPLPLVEI